MQNAVNTPQRVIVAIIVPIVGYFAIHAIAKLCHIYQWSNSTPVNDFESTWGLWLVVVLAVGAFEFFWFRTPKQRE